ncbi:hypothetical protein V6U90_02290 [Micromonospora sp. CPCC 206060]|uniref:hypothetical protein n=1 Tax=Micromonospora sp. CPCC 206060 TaxID=3122406 RepID=UPI002FF37F6D
MSDAHLSARHPLDEPQPVELAPEPIPLGYPDPAEDRRRGTPAGRRKRILLGAVLLVSLAGLTAGGLAGWRVVSQKDAVLEVPADAGGLRRDDSQRALATAEYLRSGFAADIELDRSIGAVYQDPADPKRSVLVFGGTTLLWQPERDLDSLFTLMSDETGKVTSIRDVPAGDLGGVMKCGRTTDAEGSFAVCGWADHGSVVMAMFANRDADSSAALLRQLRQDMQTRR